MLWVHTPTPFTSMFNNVRRASNWARMREQRFGMQNLGIVVIDTYNVAVESLWDAHAVALHLGFQPAQVRNHEHEYLFHDTVAAERVLAVIPAQGQPLTIPVHLGTLGLPAAFVNAIGAVNEQAVVEAIMNEVYVRCGTYDQARCEQTVHGLCIGRLDDVTTAG